MSQVVVTAQGSFRVVPGEPWRTQALALVPLLDEWTQASPRWASARSLSRGAQAHVARGTLVFTGLPGQALPSLATSDQLLGAELSVPGSLPQRVDVLVPLGSGLPYTAPAQAVASAVIAVAGRVSSDAFPHAAIAGATLSFAGGSTPLLGFAVPLAAAHDLGVTVRARTLTPGPATTLTAPARAGDQTLSVASTAGFGAGQPLLLATGEYAVVDSAAGANLLVLRLPLRSSAAASSVVNGRTLGAVGAATTLNRRVEVGDGVARTAANLSGPVVELVDGPATEFRDVGLITDADGRWRLSGVRGIADLVITTSAAGFVTDGPRSHPLAPIDPYVINTALRT